MDYDYAKNKFIKDKWKDYPELITDTWWDFQKRASHSTHKGDYHGNFIPQIPFQSLMRYTKPGDTVLDVFVGSGTSLIEAVLLDRNGVGIDLSRDAVELSKKRVGEANSNNLKIEFILGDCTEKNTVNLALCIEEEGFDHVFVHPPYADIIKFSDNPKDLSNANLSSFYQKMIVLEDFISKKLLKKNKFCTLVIGDAYKDGEVIPLGFKLMEIFQNRMKLKSINVKNISGNEKAKGKNANLWRYRALANNFQVFTHEYVMIFQNT